MVIDDSVRRQLPAGLALAWGFPPAAGRRGPKPAHSVDRIVQAAVDLADAAGFAALSMPKIAGRLGISANALYRYISSKEELLVLLADTGWGPPSESLRRNSHWRPAAIAWVYAVMARYDVHPWLLDMPVRGAPMTPNLLHWLEVLLDSLAGYGLDDHDMLGCVLLLNGYARSTAALARDLRDDSRPVQSAAGMEFLLPLLGERGLPRVAAIMTAGNYTDNGVEDNDIEFGLARILAGMDVLITGKQAH